VVPGGKFILPVTARRQQHQKYGASSVSSYVSTDCEELYQTNWRSTTVDSALPFPAVIPPSPSPSVQAATATAKLSPARLADAYRPPSTRGHRESLSGTPHGGNSSATTLTRQPNGHGRRYVPGATASPSPNTDAGNLRKPNEGSVPTRDLVSYCSICGAGGGE
jgi:hypothetical protein